MARSCNKTDIDVARKQAARMLKEAESMIPAKSACAPQLKSAQTAFKAIEKLKGSTLERRNAYVRATFQLGQARTCAVVAGIVPLRKLKKPKATKATKTSKKPSTKKKAKRRG